MGYVLAESGNNAALPASIIKKASFCTQFLFDFICAKYALDPDPDLDPEPEPEPKLF
jgi:hypothetical protein